MKRPHPIESAKKKYKEWKDKQYTQFRDQSDDSYKETKKEAEKIKNVYIDDRKLEKVVYQFSKSNHSKIFNYSKKVFHWSFIITAILFLIIVLLIGLMKFINLADPSLPKDEWVSEQETIWKIFLIQYSIIAFTVCVYMIPSFIHRVVVDSKMKNDINYEYIFHANKIMVITMLVVILFSFFTLTTFSFTPYKLIMFINYNNPAGQFMVIFTFFVFCVLFVNTLLLLSSFICSWITSPKFNPNILFSQINKE